MGMKKIYTCDICREEKSPEQLLGVVFEDLHKFKLGFPSDTDGVHICIECGKQLKELLRDMSHNKE